MYSQAKPQPLPRSSNLFLAQAEQTKLPAIFTHGGSAKDSELLKSLEDVEKAGQDEDQKLSEQLKQCIVRMVNDKMSYGVVACLTAVSEKDVDHIMRTWYDGGAKKQAKKKLGREQELSVKHTSV